MLMRMPLARRQAYDKRSHWGFALIAASDPCHAARRYERWCQRGRSSTSRVRTVRAVSRRTACERSRSSSSASNVLMSSDCVATRRARMSLRRRASETRTVMARLAAMQSLLCMMIRSWPHTGLAAEGTRATRASHLRTQEQRSVEGLARIADLDPEVPPFVAREQAAQLVPSDL